MSLNGEIHNVYNLYVIKNTVTIVAGGNFTKETNNLESIEQRNNSSAEETYKKCIYGRNVYVLKENEKHIFSYKFFDVFKFEPMIKNFLVTLLLLAGSKFLHLKQVYRNMTFIRPIYQN